MNICIFGDSITWGCHDPESGGWASRLRNHYETKTDGDVMVFNLGIPGDTTESLLQRFANEAQTRDPQLIIFAIGINDALHLDFSEVPIVSEQEFGKNLTKLIDTARDFTDDIIFLGLTRVEEAKTTPIPWSRTGKNFLNKNIEAFDSIIRSVCGKYHVEYLEIDSLLGHKDLYDGLHPNSEGHQKIFEKVKWFLERKYN